MVVPSTLPPTRSASGLRQRKRPASEPKMRLGEYPGLKKLLASTFGQVALTALTQPERRVVQVSSRTDGDIFQAGEVNFRFYMMFMWGLAALGIILFLVIVLAPQPGAAPLGAMVIFYAVALAITGPMVWVGVSSAVRYRRILGSGAVAAHAIRLSRDGIAVDGNAALAYPWTAFREVMSDSDYRAIGPIRQKSPGALLLFRKAPGVQVPGLRRKIVRAAARGVLAPIDLDEVLVLPLRFFHRDDGNRLAARARSLHQSATAVPGAT